MLCILERIIVSIPPNPRRVGYIDPIHGPLDGPLYMDSHIHQHTGYKPEKVPTVFYHGQMVEILLTLVNLSGISITGSFLLAIPRPP